MSEHTSFALYEAYGTRPYEWGDDPDRQKANTKEEETDLNLLNEGMRYRDLETGTFMNRDPIRYGDGPNVYCYVHCNPITKFDALGLSETDENAAAAAAQAAAEQARAEAEAAAAKAAEAEAAQAESKAAQEQYKKDDTSENLGDKSGTDTASENQERNGGNIASASTVVSGIAGGLEVATEHIKPVPARNPVSKLPMSGTELTQPYKKVGSFAQKIAKPLAIAFTVSEVKGIGTGEGSFGNKSLKVVNTVSMNVATFYASSFVVAAASTSGGVGGVCLGVGGGIAIGSIGDSVKSSVNETIDKYMP